MSGPLGIPTGPERHILRPFWPALDGLRAIAVISVIVFHAGVKWGANGFGGVDVFFTLSGFLITTLLLNEHRRVGSISLSSFWLRRLLRLYPALLVTCLTTIAISVITRHQLQNLLVAAVSSAFYYANWLYSTGHDMVLLDHTWTLSLEEQFYLIWPPILVLIMARKWCWIALCLGAVTTVVLAVALSGTSWFGPVSGTYIRAIPMFMGCLLALALSRERVRGFLDRAPSIALPAAILLLCALLIIPYRLDTALTQGPGSLAAWLSLIIITTTTSPRPNISRSLLENRWAAWIGKRSYGLYLYHFPIIMLALFQLPSGLPHSLALSIAFVLTLAVTQVSYRYIERPFMRMKNRLEPSMTANPLTPPNG